MGKNNRSHICWRRKAKRKEVTKLCILIPGFWNIKKNCDKRLQKFFNMAAVGRLGTLCLLKNSRMASTKIIPLRNFKTGTFSLVESTAPEVTKAPPKKSTMYWRVRDNGVWYYPSVRMMFPTHIFFFVFVFMGAFFGGPTINMP